MTSLNSLPWNTSSHFTLHHSSSCHVLREDNRANVLERQELVTSQSRGCQAQQTRSIEPNRLFWLALECSIPKTRRAYRLDKWIATPPRFDVILLGRCGSRVTGAISPSRLRLTARVNDQQNDCNSIVLNTLHNQHWLWLQHCFNAYQRNDSCNRFNNQSLLVRNFVFNPYGQKVSHLFANTSTAKSVPPFG